MNRTSAAAAERVLAWAKPRAEAAALSARAGIAAALTTADPPPAWRGPWRRRVGQAAAGAATAVLGLIALIGFYQGLGLVMSVRAALIVAATGLVIRYPLLSYRLAWLALVLSVTFTSPVFDVRPWRAVLLPVLLAAFWVAGVRHGRRVIWPAWALTLLPLWLYVAGTRSAVDRTGAVLAFTAVAVAADSVSSRRHAQRDLAEQEELTELEQARRAVLTERARIARELHDVVAHHMSLIAVRAETAPFRLSDVDEPVRAEFHALSGAAREALTDMRRLLGVLRDDGPPGLAPQPQLTDLPALVASARLAGLAVDLTMPPDTTAVPAPVGVCAYRVVQESLSNASRHAPGAAVAVTVARGDEAIWLRVTNAPSGKSSVPRPDGQGLTGMRERVGLLGGQLSAGPEPGGGFAVAARLPLGAPVPVAPMAGSAATWQSA